MIYLLGAVLCALFLLDWKQTLKIADNPNTYFERNPTLGEHPSRKQVHVHFSLAIVLLVGLLIAATLYPIYSLSFMYGLAGGIVVELLCTINNARIGL